MLSATAVTLALAFWAPYGHGQPVCPDGVQIHRVGYYDTPGSAPSYAYTSFGASGELVPNCNVYLDPQFRGADRALLCAVIARAIGAAWFGLPPSRNPRNVMYERAWVTPAACYT